MILKIVDVKVKLFVKILFKNFFDYYKIEFF